MSSLIALNCDTLVAINSTNISPCEKGCANIGDEMDISVKAAFPDEPLCAEPIAYELTLTILNTDTGSQTVIDVYNDGTTTGLPSNPEYTTSFTLSEYGNYEITLYAAMTCEETLYASSTCVVNVGVCFNYQVKKTACHKYDLYDSVSGVAKINTLTITNHAGTYESVLTLDTSSETFVSVTFPNDDVYLVTVTNNLNNDVFKYVIYDFCDYITCLRKLILEIFCNEADPCFDGCSEKEKEKLLTQRADMNKMLALAAALFASIKRMEITYLGVFGIDDCREVEIQEISDMFEKINEITGRCGECVKSSSVTTKPCSNC